MGANSRRKIDYILRNNEGHQRSRNDDIFSIWDDQKQMQAEDRKIKEELRRAKQQAKALKRELRKNQIGDASFVLSGSIAQVVKWVRQKIALVIIYTQKNKKITAVGISVLLVITITATALTSRNNRSETLGDSTENVSAANVELTREQPVFALLYPQGSDDTYDTVRINPKDTNPAYTYIDKITKEEVPIRITQQEIPDNFDLKNVATAFQATNTITLDEIIVYHGYSEKEQVQSLIFIKKDKLISVRSPQVFSDDVWVAYITALK